MESTTNEPEPRASRRSRASLSTVARALVARPWRVFLVAFALFFAIIAAWSLATPPFASPDEPAHTVRAVSLLRGQLIGTGPTSSNVTRVTLPEFYASGQDFVPCFAHKATAPASCAGPFSGSSRTVSITTSAGRYPPLYYAIVGLPSLVTVSATGFYLMRLMSDLLSAVFLALSVMSVVVWSKGRLLLVGVLVAATPTTIFLASVINPNGLEITAALCLWCSGLILVRDCAADPPRGLIMVVVAAAVGLMLARGLSPLWVVLIALTLAIVAGWRTTHRILTAKWTRWSLIVLVPSALFAVVWIVAAHGLNEQAAAPSLRPQPNLSLVADLLGATGPWIKQMIGVFGWLDTYSPYVTYLAWSAVLGLLILLALVCWRNVREAVGLVLLIALVILVPIVLTYMQAAQLGVIWQARYILPLAVGLPLLSAEIIEKSKVLRSVQSHLAVLVCALLGVGQVCAWSQTLIRYTTGLGKKGGFFNNLLGGSWQPPGGGLLLLVLFILAMFLLIAYCCYLVWLGPPPADDPALSAKSLSWPSAQSEDSLALT